MRLRRVPGPWSLVLGLRLRRVLGPACAGQSAGSSAGHSRGRAFHIKNQKASIIAHQSNKGFSSHGWPLGFRTAKGAKGRERGRLGAWCLVMRLRRVLGPEAPHSCGAGEWEENGRMRGSLAFSFIRVADRRVGPPVAGGRMSQLRRWNERGAFSWLTRHQVLSGRHRLHATDGNHGKRMRTRSGFTVRMAASVSSSWYTSKRWLMTPAICKARKPVRRMMPA